MPIHQGYEQYEGKRMGYYVWGDQKKYYYTPGDEESRKRAYANAREQANAIYAGGYSE